MAFSKKARTHRSHTELKQEINELIESAIPQIRLDQATTEQRIEYLNFMAKMPRYSARNLALIKNQYEGARYVASFKAWKNQKASVRKGQHGIKILVPKPVTYMRNRKGEMQPLSTFSKEELAQGKAEHRDTMKKPFYGIGHVFDITQTDLKPEQYPAFYPNRPFDFGKVDHAKCKAVFESLATQAEHLGIPVKINHGEPLINGELLGAAKGVTLLTDSGKPKMIALSDRLSLAEQTSTLIHEFAHAKLHSDEGKKASKFWSATQTSAVVGMGLEELQAEMTSYVVSQSVGIDTSKEALQYVSQWTNQFKLVDQEPTKAQVALLSDIQRASSEIIDQLPLGEGQALTKSNDKQLKLEPHEEALVKLVTHQDLTMEQARQMLAFESMLPVGQRYAWRLKTVEHVMKQQPTDTLQQYQKQLEAQSSNGRASFLDSELSKVRSFLNDQAQTSTMQVNQQTQENEGEQQAL